MFLRLEIFFGLLLIIHLNRASNYDSYINRLMDDGQQLHHEFLEINPNAQILFDRFTSPNSPHLKFQENEPDGYHLSDREWNQFLQQYSDSKREILNPPNDRELVDDPLTDRSLRGSESPLTYLPSEDELPETELALRRNEVAFQNQLWGEHKVSGGSGEIGKWLEYALIGAGAQDNDTAPMMTSSEAKGGLFYSTPLVHTGEHDQIKVDTLPAYCDPPNPCPLNYDPDSLPTPCDRNVENTVEFNREWIQRKMANGDCYCDSEHMLNCPDPLTLRLKDSAFGQEFKDIGESLQSNPYLRGQKRKRLVPKKRVKRSWYSHYNPYLMGRPHRTAVKKTGNYPTSPNRAM